MGILVGLRASTTPASSELLKAAARGDLTQPKRLLGAKPDLNARGKDGSTALMLASRQGDPEVARWLRQSGAR
jgi:ankyrin repeat protein